MVPSQLQAKRCSKMSFYKLKSHMALALLLILSILAKYSSATDNQTSTVLTFKPTPTQCKQNSPAPHLSLTSNITRFDFACRIKNESLGIDIDIEKMTNNQTMVEIPNIKLDGGNKKMLLGICQGLPRTLACEGKSRSTTKACLLDASDNSTVRSANNSQIVGSTTRSYIRLSEDRVYMESFAHKNCSEANRKDLNVTQQLGTRIEFYCSNETRDKPTFLRFDNCSYVFEWGSPFMCLKTFTVPKNESGVSNETKIVAPKVAIVPTNIDTKNVSDSGSSKNETSSKPEAKPTVKSPNKPSTMNSAHKFFMISLIVMSFAAFIVIIFILDKKTRLRVTLRQARQAFQTNHQQPYSRVVNNLDL